MRKISLVVFLFIALLSLNACNTIQGVGKDIKEGGEALERAGKNR